MSYALPSRGGRCYRIPLGPDTELARATSVQPNGRTGGRGGKLPTAVEVDEVVQDLCDPTVDQTEKEKTPNDCDNG